MSTLENKVNFQNFSIRDIVVLCTNNDCKYFIEFVPLGRMLVWASKAFTDVCVKHGPILYQKIWISLLTLVKLGCLVHTKNVFCWNWSRLWIIFEKCQRKSSMCAYGELTATFLRLSVPQSLSSLFLLLKYMSVSFFLHLSVPQSFSSVFLLSFYFNGYFFLSCS